MSHHTLGNKIKQRRLQKGFKQDALAELIGISQATLSRIENDKEDISFKKLEQLSQALETPMSYFTSDSVHVHQENISINDQASGVSIHQYSASQELIEELKNLLAQKDNLISSMQTLIASIK